MYPPLDPRRASLTSLTPAGRRTVIARHPDRPPVDKDPQRLRQRAWQPEGSVFLQQGGQTTGARTRWRPAGGGTIERRIGGIAPGVIRWRSRPSSAAAAAAQRGMTDSVRQSSDG